MSNSRNTARSVLKYVLYTLFGLFLTFSATATALLIWYDNTFDIEFKTLLYVLSSPLKGTGSETVNEILSVCIPTAVITVAIYVGIIIAIERLLRPKHPKIGVWVKSAGALICAASLVFTAVFAIDTLRIMRYLEIRNAKTTFYEEYYIKPIDELILSDGETKNLLYIYLESMEVTYTSTEEGGKQAQNYMPLLSDIARENISFSNNVDGKLGGFLNPEGTGWTVGALLGTSSGIPFSFPLGENGNNAMSREKYFASGLITLGDILEDEGYRQMFLCGSDIKFGGRDKYYTQHGNYEIYDLATARSEGVIAPDYHNGFWGFEDYILFDIAKTQLTELSSGDQPFNLTMLTVDAHHNGGFKCKYCGRDYIDLPAKNAYTANVITCIDKQMSEFLNWCSEQDWYEDTTIIITGDHPRMDVRLVSKIPASERTIYNCFINSAVEPNPEGEYSTEGRIWTAFDMFPTTLAAMGFEIIGDRLGLGTNMFSGLPTLAEELGYDVLNTEIQKFSAYYIGQFCPELADRVQETEAPATEKKTEE